MPNNPLGYACAECLGVFHSLKEVVWKKNCSPLIQKYICGGCLSRLIEEHKVDGDISCDLCIPHATGEMRAIPTRKNLL